ncbi:MAG: saccharopine dehydrogenase C-terminal domain-containing protein [Bacteroidales bacterium]|nr:saccharopine dehydrogenase C-terminal domain-containing protein [Bacteroidales bacterium]
MKKVLILGAGLSTISLIKYLLKNAEVYDWHVIVGDLSEKAAREKVGNHERGTAIVFDILNEAASKKTIAEADVVISMLPAFMHKLVIEKCIEFKKPMLTASYVTDDIKALNDRVLEAGIPVFMELGVDPGIDHMSAMKVINRIKDAGGEVTSFYSFTGGLVAPEYDNNPWNYKFTWNPRNVVMAGTGVSQYINNGRYKYIPYFHLFDRILNRRVLKYGDFEVYPNRDSLKYREIYDLKDIPSMFRGTMRRPGFSKAWNVFVTLGCTDDTYRIENSENMTYREFINTFMKYQPDVPVEIKLQDYCPNAADPIVFEKLKWLGIFSDRKIGLKNATPAQILQKLLEEKWTMDPDDKDMIVMQHEFKYKLNGAEKMIVSAMAVIGNNQEETAMAITVGTPLAIATKLVLTGEFAQKGIQIPIRREIYEPILAELESFGIRFEEQEYLIA